MMTSDNYSTPRRYQVEKSEGRSHHKESERKETGSYHEEHGTGASDSTDLATPDSKDRRSRAGRRSKDHVTETTAASTEDGEVEGATAAEQPKSLKKEKTGKKRKDRKNLREKRRSTGVVIMPGAASNNDEQADEARQTIDNTKQNESIGIEEVSPSLSDVSPGTPGRSSRNARDDVDLDRRDKQDLLDRLEQLEHNLDKKTKEVETLKTENQRLRDDNNALLRVVNQVSSLKAK